MKLYDDYGLYINKIKNNEKDKPKSSRPEDILFYHFIKNDLKITKTKAIKIKMHHVCSEYCSHNKEKILT